MDCVQFAGHLDLSEHSSRIAGVTGPFRGVVQAKRKGVAELSGRYMRVWLDNGYGVVVCEPYDADGETGNRPLTLVPVRHIDGYGETMWRTAYQDGECVRDGEAARMVAVDGPDGIAAGVRVLDALSALDGHVMRAVLRDAA
jgi:hypothetical protein